MCGICGVIGLPVERARASTLRMARAMAHRGPDDEGFADRPLTAEVSGPAAAFGFRRLAILDLSPAGHQPMVHPQTGDVLVFNGEIYNFRELRRVLESRGRNFRSSGDTEVLLHALTEWGEEALDDLDGMFSLAFFQAHSRRVLLARDPLGIKPLYVARTPEAIVFASEVRAVLASGLVADDLDPAGIASFLAYGAPQDPLTVHRFVRSLPGGSSEWIGLDSLGSGTTAARRYWWFPRVDPTPLTEPALIRNTRSVLTESVLRQCVADVPVGVFLSAGIDSATIAALAQPQHGSVHTFSVGYTAAAQQDETTGARETAAMLGTRHREAIVDDARAATQFPAWLEAADRPTIDGLNTFIVCGALKEQGLVVALSGLGADEMFGGYESFARAMRLRRMMAPFTWMPRWLVRGTAHAALCGAGEVRRTKAVEMIAHGSRPTDFTIAARRLFSDGSLGRLGFEARWLGLTPHWLPADAYGALEPTGDAFVDVSQAEMWFYMSNTLLRDSDVYSMAHSVELRVPFLGRDVVNSICALPGSVRRPPRSRPKHLLREAMRGALPQAVFNRPKTGFTLPVDAWMRGPLREVCDAAVESLAECSLFSRAELRHAWKSLSAPGAEPYSPRRLARVALGHYLGSVRRPFGRERPT